MRRAQDRVDEYYRIHLKKLSDICSNKIIKHIYETRKYPRKPTEFELDSVIKWPDRFSAKSNSLPFHPTARRVARVSEVEAR